jgi:phage baseplate assembly protein W
MTRSQYITFSRTKKPVVYSDFRMNFDRVPNTGNLDIVTNEEAVKQSIRNLVMTIRGERFYQPFLGTKINALLFELPGPTTITDLKSEIRDVLQYEPRATDIESIIEYHEDFNAYAVTIMFRMVNIPDAISVSFLLKRIR